MVMKEWSEATHETRNVSQVSLEMIIGAVSLVDNEAEGQSICHQLPIFSAPSRVIRMEFPDSVRYRIQLGPQTWAVAEELNISRGNNGSESDSRGINMCANNHAISQQALGIVTNTMRGPTDVMYSRWAMGRHAIGS